MKVLSSEKGKKDIVKVKRRNAKINQMLLKVQTDDKKEQKQQQVKFNLKLTHLKRNFSLFIVVA